MPTSAKRNAQIQITSNASGVGRGIADARRQMQKFQRDQSKKFHDQEHASKRTTGRIKGVAGAIGGDIMSAAGFDVMGIASSFAGELLDVEKEMTRFQIDAGLSADQVGKFRTELLYASQTTGQSRLAILKGAHAYQTITGDADGAMQSVQLFAQVANASGASMEDIATTAASMKQNLSMDPKDFRKGFDILLTMGHKGAIELRDMASQMSGLAPQFKDFGSKGSVDKLAELGATLQVVRNNFGDAAEAATGMRSLMTAVTNHQDKLAKYGVKVFTIDPKTKQLVKRDFLDIVQDILKNPALNDKVLPKLLGRQEAMRALTAMRDHWDEIGQLQQQSLNSDQVTKDNLTYMQSTAGKLALAWETVKNAAAEALTPERITAFADAMVKIADATASFVKGLDKIASLTPGFDAYFGAAAGPNSDKARGYLKMEHYISEGEGMSALEKDKRSRELIAEAAAAKKTFGLGDDDPEVRSRRSAAEELYNQAQNAKNSVDYKAMARAMAEVLGRAPMAVKVGGEAITRARNNSISQGTRPGGR